MEGLYGSQNAYNVMAIKNNVPDIDNRCNWCDNRHPPCEDAVVLGYHGYTTYGKKMSAMQRDLKVLNGK
jgi:hypothetical protein